VDTFLSHEWVGLALAAPVALLAWAGFRRTRTVSKRWIRITARVVSAVTAATATLLTAGSAVHLAQVARDSSAYPPGGKLIDVGGYRLHLLAEGPNAIDERDHPATVVLIPGGYAQGLAMYHLHAKLRSRTRSIIYDHAGTGWSDVGPFPRTPALEADELKRLLDGAGEKGPFVVVGHSLGGLLANNFAAKYPQDVAGLVLFDPTPIASSEISRGSPQVRALGAIMRATALAHAFGLSFAFKSTGGFVVPAAHAEVLETQMQQLGPARAAFESRERRAQANIAAASMIGGFFIDPSTDLVRKPGALGELPMIVVYSNALRAQTWPEEQQAQYRRIAGVKSDAEWTAMLALLERADREVQSLSSQARRVDAPEGGTHNFPYEFPEFCLQQIQALLEQHVAPSLEPPTG
jgi:pimeloyl-ACP methyl ester carboxylesterase